MKNALGEYACEICDRAFTELHRLEKHLECHTDPLPHECLDCGKRFSKFALMRTHRKRQHGGARAFTCDVCKKGFFSAHKLREHVRTHTGEAPLLCNVCGKGFKRHSNLSEHKRIHDPDREPRPVRELFCQTCGKLFTTMRDLNWHVEETHER